MIRVFDADKVNRIINDPAIRPAVGGDVTQPIDVTAAIADSDNVFMLGDNGGFAAIWCAPGVFELHAFVTGTGRGRWALEEGLAFLRFMQGFGARHVWARVPDSAAHVKWFVREVGMTPCGFRVHDFGGGPTRYQHFEMRF